jgi:PAS domain S-box-containing protein
MGVARLGGMFRRSEEHWMKQDPPKKKSPEQSGAAAEAPSRRPMERVSAIVYEAACDETRTTQSISPQVEPLLGFAPSDFESDPLLWNKQLHPDDRERVLGELARTRMDGEPFVSEYRMFSRDGRVVWFRDQGAVVRDAKGASVTLRGVMCNVTEHRAAEAGLQDSVGWLRVLFEFAPDGYLLASEEGVLLDENRAAEEMMGTPRKDVVGGKPGEMGILTPEGLAQVIALFQSTTVGGQGAAGEFTVTRGDGTSGTMEIRVFPVLFRGTRAVLAIARDMTEPRRVQETLRQSEQRFRAVFENSTVPMVLTAPDGRMLMVNSALCRMLDYTPSELAGRSALDITHPDDLAVTRSNAERLTQGGESSFRVEKRYIHKDGHVIWADVSVADVRDAQGRFLYFVTHIQDITERKEAGEALAQRTRSLAVLNDLAMELAFLPSDAVPGTLVKHLMATTGAIVASIAKYDPARRVLVPSRVEIEPEMREQAQELLGKSLLDIRSPVSEEMYRKIISTIVGEAMTLTETTFGAVPPAAGTAIQEALGIGRFIGIAYMVGGELYGTSVLAMRPGTPDPPSGLLASFAHMAAISLRRCVVEEALHESEEKFRALAEQSPNMIFINKKGRIVYANKRCEEVMGCAREEFCSPDFDFLCLCPPEWKDIVSARFQKDMKGEEAKPLEYSLLTKDGRRIEVILTTRVSSYEGETAVFGTVTDVSELRRLQGQVLESAKKERRRISRDMHDVLGQNLTGAAMLSEALEKSLAGVSPSEAPKAARITKLLYEATGDVRQFAKGLSPVDTTPEGLMKALEELAGGASRLFGISCRFRSPETVLVHDELVAEHLYRIAQEAITNSVKHGGGRRTSRWPCGPRRAS